MTLGGIDKAGHMWGGLNDVPPYPAGAEDPLSHMANAAKVADEQVGRVIAKLKADGVLDETLVVLTTDHAQLTGENYYGLDGLNRGNFNWYYGARRRRDLPDAAAGDPEADRRDQRQRQGEHAGLGDPDLADRPVVPGQEAGRRRDGDARRRQGDVLPRRGQVQAAVAGTEVGVHGEGVGVVSSKHGQEIVNTEAANYGPDVIGLLGDNTSYGVEGRPRWCAGVRAADPDRVLRRGCEGRAPSRVARSARSTSRRRSSRTWGSRRPTGPTGSRTASRSRAEGR